MNFNFQDSSLNDEFLKKITKRYKIYSFTENFFEKQGDNVQLNYYSLDLKLKLKNFAKDEHEYIERIKNNNIFVTRIEKNEDIKKYTRTTNIEDLISLNNKKNTEDTEDLEYSKISFLLEKEEYMDIVYPHVGCDKNSFFIYIVCFFTNFSKISKSNLLSMLKCNNLNFLEDFEKIIDEEINERDEKIKKKIKEFLKNQNMKKIKYMIITNDEGESRIGNEIKKTEKNDLFYIYEEGIIFFKKRIVKKIFFIEEESNFVSLLKTKTKEKQERFEIKNYYQEDKIHSMYKYINIFNHELILDMEQKLLMISLIFRKNPNSTIEQNEQKNILEEISQVLKGNEKNIDSFLKKLEIKKNNKIMKIFFSSIVFLLLVFLYLKFLYLKK